VKTSRLSHFFYRDAKRCENWFVVDGNNDLKKKRRLSGKVMLMSPEKNANPEGVRDGSSSNYIRLAALFRVRE
jgi:hypothetical protein